VRIFNARGQTIDGHQFFAYLPRDVGEIRKRRYDTNLLGERWPGLKRSQCSPDKKDFPQTVSPKTFHKQAPSILLLGS
jgi:hypothetical protein